MKILEVGRADVEPAKENYHPWVGKKIQCARCDCVFLLESSDEYEKVKCHRDDLGHAEMYSLSCPNPICERHIQLEPDELRRESKIIKR